MEDYRQKALELTKSMETGDNRPLSYINPDNYTQHNLTMKDGLQGLMERRGGNVQKGSFRVKTLRIFQDGDSVFMHNEFAIPNNPLIGFDIFRFEDGMIVEHWDNFQQEAAKPSPSGHTMSDGPTTASDIDKTETNKALIKNFMEDLINGHRERFPGYFDGDSYTQHNPLVADNLTGLLAGLKALATQGLTVKYTKVHKILGEGNFVLAVSEGYFGNKLSSYYDLYRIQNEKIAEHWDTIQAIPPNEEWKNSNGKF
jgi:predicted SnoaL-like aldol condensation-catalyzing enzyme